MSSSPTYTRTPPSSPSDTTTTTTCPVPASSPAPIHRALTPPSIYSSEEVTRAASTASSRAEHRPRTPSSIYSEDAQRAVSAASSRATPAEERLSTLSHPFNGCYNASCRCRRPRENPRYYPGGRPSRKRPKEGQGCPMVGQHPIMMAEVEGGPFHGRCDTSCCRCCLRDNRFQTFNKPSSSRNDLQQTAIQNVLLRLFPPFQGGHGPPKG